MRKSEIEGITPRFSLSHTFRQLFPEHLYLLVPDVVEVFVFELQIVRRVFGHDYIRFLYTI